MADRNTEIIALLRELAELQVLDDQDPQSFRARAYEQARHSLEGVSVDLGKLSVGELQKLPGIGKATASKVREYFDTGRIAKLEGLRARFPPDVVRLARIPGIGPKRLAQLRDLLDVHTVDDLRVALDAGRLQALPRWGERTEENVRRALDRLGWKHGEQRTPIADAVLVVSQLVRQLAALPGVAAVVPCGSVRRLAETVGDIDIVVAADPPGAITAQVAAHPLVHEVLGRGDTKVSFLTAAGLQVDVRVVAPRHLGAATLYFTGSKNHNIRLRERAQRRGWTLNEYALTVEETGEVVASETEEAIYAALDMPFVPPPMREDTGEVQAAVDGTLPAWVRVEDLLGDLHVHTTYSGDGRSSIDEMVAAAVGRGHRYLAITDHGEDLVINGVSRDDLARQSDDLERLRERHPGLLLMRGCELNIGRDGGLDYDPAFRESLDWCIAAVHEHFDLPQARQTERVIRAIADPTVRVIAHLTGRMIGRRPGIELDVDAVLDALVAHDTALELNSALPRLDAAADVLRRAMDKGVLVVISTDAHHVTELERHRWGASHAQRGWVRRDRVLNTWSPEDFARWWRREG